MDWFRADEAELFDEEFNARAQRNSRNYGFGSRPRSTRSAIEGSRRRGFLSFNQLYFCLKFVFLKCSQLNLLKCSMIKMVRFQEIWILAVFFLTGWVDFSFSFVIVNFYFVVREFLAKNEFLNELGPEKKICFRFRHTSSSRGPIVEMPDDDEDVGSVQKVSQFWPGSRVCRVSLRQPLNSLAKKETR